jgi:hypothetical protein
VSPFTHASPDGRSVWTHGSDFRSQLECAECRPVLLGALAEALTALSDGKGEPQSDLPPMGQPETPPGWMAKHRVATARRRSGSQG